MSQSAARAVPSSLAGQTSPKALVLDMATRYWQSQCLFVAAELGVADALKDGALSAEDLAQRVGARPQHLKRVLRALASSGVFHEDGEGRFALNEMADVLREDHPQSARAYVRMVVDDWNWDSWRGLLHGVRSGDVPFDHELKQPYFEFLATHPDKEKVFADSMSSFSALHNAAVTAAYPFNEIKTLVDVGGSNGHLLATILKQHTHLKGVLFDLPGVAEKARKAGYITAPELEGRISAEGGDAFKAVPQGADAYLLKSVIHDWDDDHAVQILENCRKAMAPGGRVLLAEGIVKEANAPDFLKFMDLAMFVSSGGQERTEAEFRALLARAGLKFMRIFPTQAGRNVIEAVQA